MERLSSILALIILTGCSTLKSHESRSIMGINAIENSNIDVHKLAQENYATLNERYKKEWEFSHISSSPPRLGIALSGGGTRSAAFNMGILSGLQKIGVLEQADVISTVSGGGYIASWYYLQHLYSDRYVPKEYPKVSDADLFSITGKYQIYLSTHGELLGTTMTKPIRYAEYLNYFLLTLGSVPVNFVFNGVFGTHFNDVPMRRIYQNGIEREFHVVPKGKDDDEYNQYSILGVPFGVKEEATFQELRESVKSKKLPFPIINTSAYISGQASDNEYLKNRVFEFTPLSYGSDYFGYSDNHQISVNKAYAISGAAADSTIIPNAFYSTLASGLNVDLGYYIDNYNLSEAQQTLPRLLPFPFYLLSGRYNNDINGTSIYLTDGGHVENLGAYSLIRRLTKKIIISDAEADPLYQFDAYRNLKSAVQKELHAELNVPEIEAWLKQCDSQVNKERCMKQVLPYKSIKPVMSGTISSFPFIENGAEVNVSIQVLYIKAVVSQDRITASLDNGNKQTSGVAGYPISISNYYILGEGAKAGRFPQQSTIDQSYTPYQVSAYRDLGYGTIIENEHLFDSLQH